MNLSRQIIIRVELVSRASIGNRSSIRAPSVSMVSMVRELSMHRSRRPFRTQTSTPH
jgi:hypothetical protein